MTKVRVAAAHEIEAGKIHHATIGETELILIRSQGAIRAFSGCCPHQRAPLADGMLSGNRIICPWHQAVFHAADGRLVEPPALEGLEAFAVEVRGDDVWIDTIDGVPQPHRPDVVERVDLSTEERWSSSARAPPESRRLKSFDDRVSPAG